MRGVDTVLKWLQKHHVGPIALVLGILGITVILFWFAYGAASVQVAYVTVSPTSLSSGVGAPAIQATGDAENGLVPLAISGSITPGLGPVVSHMTLIIGPSGSGPARKQANCCVVSNGTYGGTGQLATAESSAPFQLLDSYSGTVQAAGNITANVESFPGGSRLAQKTVAYLGLLAAVIAFVQLVIDRSARPDPSRAKGTQEPTGETSHAEQA
jgi:hypothetical protein